MASSVTIVTADWITTLVLHHLFRGGIVLRSVPASLWDSFGAMSDPMIPLWGTINHLTNIILISSLYLFSRHPWESLLDTLNTPKSLFEILSGVTHLVS